MWTSIDRLATAAGLLLALLASDRSLPAAAADAARQPVIVELFTSEGCSSCPPADAFLETLDQSQPVPNALVIALSEHVDYWDNLGWKDPFSSPLFSRRQEEYARRLHLDSVYTPQMVIDGGSEAVGVASGKIMEAIRKSAAAPKLRVRISPVQNNPKGIPTVHIDVDPSGKSASSDHLMLALAEDTAATQVLRGENSGRKLKHVAVVRHLADFGGLAPAGSRGIDIPLTGELQDWRGKRLVVFIQDRQHGRIGGAAYLLLPTR